MQAQVVHTTARSCAASTCQRTCPANALQRCCSHRCLLLEPFICCLCCCCFSLLTPEGLGDQHGVRIGSCCSSTVAWLTVLLLQLLLLCLNIFNGFGDVPDNSSSNVRTCMPPWYIITSQHHVNDSGTQSARSFYCPVANNVNRGYAAAAATALSVTELLVQSRSCKYAATNAQLQKLCCCVASILHHGCSCCILLACFENKAQP